MLASADYRAFRTHLQNLSTENYRLVLQLRGPAGRAQPLALLPDMRANLLERVIKHNLRFGESFQCAPQGESMVPSIYGARRVG